MDKPEQKKFIIFNRSVLVCCHQKMNSLNLGSFKSIVNKWFSNVIDLSISWAMDKAGRLSGIVTGLHKDKKFAEKTPVNNGDK